MSSLKNQGSPNLLSFNDLEKADSVPQISNILEIEKKEDDHYDKTSQGSKKQPQNSPCDLEEFFEGHAIPGAEGGISEFQPLEQNENEDIISESSFSRNWDTAEPFDNDDNNGKNKGQKMDLSWSEFFLDSYNFMMKPTVIITIILMCVLILMAFQNNGMQAQFKILNKRISDEIRLANNLKNQMMHENREMTHVKNVEKDLLKKEDELQNQVNEEMQKTEDLVTKQE